MRTKTANVKLNWQPGKFGGPDTICAEITSRITATVCPYDYHKNPLNSVGAYIHIGSVLVASERWASVEQGKQWVETSLPNIALQMAEDADNLLSALGMKEVIE